MFVVDGEIERLQVQRNEDGLLNWQRKIELLLKDADEVLRRLIVFVVEQLGSAALRYRDRAPAPHSLDHCLDMEHEAVEHLRRQCDIELFFQCVDRRFHGFIDIRRDDF